MTWVLIAAAIIVAAGVLRLAASRRPPDGVDSFRRQIDALSSDARRPIVGRVNDAAQADRPPSPSVRSLRPEPQPASEAASAGSDVNSQGVGEDDADPPSDREESDNGA